MIQIKKCNILLRFLFKMTTTWYVQLGPILAKEFFSNQAKFSNTLIRYDLGVAKMKTLPKVGDSIILLGKKHELCNGEVVDMSDPNHPVLLLFEIKPVFTGKFYRRNWTVKK